MPKGWSNPKNAAPDTGGGGGFKEGLVLVDKPYTGVWQPKGAAGKAPPPPVSGLIWDVTRLAEDMEPLEAEGTDGEHLTERLMFSFGSKALSKIHPGKGSGPDDDEPEDCGSEIGVEGNTAYFVDPSFQLHPKSSMMVLMNSLIKADPKLEPIVDRGWAPDYTDCIFFMSTWVDKDMPQTYTDKNGVEVTKGTSYKVVTKVVRGPGEKKAGRRSADAGVDGKTKAAGPVEVANGKGSAAAEAILEPILQLISTEKDGTQISLKMLGRAVSEKLQNQKVEPKLIIPVLNMVKPNSGGEYPWLAKNGGKWDMSFDFPNSVVTFGVVGGE